MKKILYISIFLLSILMITCKPDPIDNGDDDTNNTDTIQEEPLVRKYLVREYADYMGRLKFIIGWNEDFTRIEYIIEDSGTYDQINYDFHYYGEDSMKVVAYTPNSADKCSNYVCHLVDDKIVEIDFYSNDEYKYTNHRTYNNDGKIISNIDSVNNCGTIFEWEGDNVIKTYAYRHEGIEGTGTTYGNFSEHIHPYYTLPHLLRGYGYNVYITQPLWKNFEACNEQFKYEYDSDGYVVCAYYVDEHGNSYHNIRYEYDY